MPARERRRRRRRRSNGRGPLGLAVVVLGTLAAIVGFSALGYVMAIAASAPPLDKPVDDGQTSSVYASDGSLLGYIQSDEIRTPIAWEQIPKNLLNATVAIEDQRFYKHSGVDYSSIVRAAVRNASSGHTVQGGSTITMQLVRNQYIADPKRDYKRKIREAKLASELESNHSKRWILQQYVNTAPYGTVGGQSAMGVQAAAQTFFSKNASQLTLAESALIAGLPQAPSLYNPFLNAPAARERRDEVLGKMLELNYITRAQHDEAVNTPVKVHRGDRYTRIREPYFFDYVKQSLIDRFGPNVVRRGGLKIYSTINPKLQKAARNAINGQLNQAGDPSSAIVSIDPKTGYIRAMASSGTFGSSEFNLAAQGLRQPGSSFKTMVLVSALRRGIDPISTTYNSYPIDIKSSPYGPIKTKTYDNTYGGVMNLQRATLRSDNSVYMQLALDVGPKYVKETARLLGITSKLNGYPAEGLGGLEYGVSPLEMSSAYATLAAGGIHSVPKAVERVVFPDGKVEKLGKPERKRVITDGVAFEATKILEQNVLGGTGVRARITCRAAGKTGTTDNFKDAWFVGFTPVMSSSVWVGYPSAGIEMRSVHGIAVAGGTFPAQIWHDYMSRAVAGRCKDFADPKVPFKALPFTGKYQADGKRHSAPTDATGKPKKKKDDKKKDDKPKPDGGDTPPAVDPPPVTVPQDPDTGAVEPQQIR